MSTADVLELIGLLFVAYSIGWASGYVFYIFRRLSDYI